MPVDPTKPLQLSNGDPAILTSESTNKELLVVRLPRGRIRYDSEEGEMASLDWSYRVSDGFFWGAGGDDAYLTLENAPDPIPSGLTGTPRRRRIKL